MTLYEALEGRSAWLAQLTNDLAPIAHLVQTVAMGAARWAHRSRCDVVAAKVNVIVSRDDFSLRLYRPTGLVIVPVFTSPIASTFETAVRFVRHHPDAVDVMQALSSWALVHVAKGVSRFDGRWAPGSEGFVAIHAVPVLNVQSA